MSDSKFSLNDLEGRSYRDLQQLAKSLGLPSNVKKIYLIQLIYAKKFKTAVEVGNIVQRVKLERQRFARVRKSATRKRIYLQNTVISSTSSSLSPPISATPKRPGHIMQCNPDIRHTIMKYPRQSLLHSSFVKKTYPSPTKPSSSDRVLRSFSLKSQNSKLNANSNILKVIKAQSSMNMRPAVTQGFTSVSVPNQTRISIVSQDKSYPRINVTAKCIGKKHKTYVRRPRSGLATNETTGQMVSVQDKHVQTNPIPLKRQRVISGVYPINKEATPKVSYEYIQSIGFRRSDGKVSKINALVQKTLNNTLHLQNIRNIEMTMQELINCNIESQNMASECNVPDSLQSLQYPNMSSIDYMPPSPQKQFNHYDMPSVAYKENEAYQSSVYYHKKIRGEQIRSQRRESLRDDRNVVGERLPNINEVFSKFRDVPDVTQPIYVQVSNESERILNYPLYVSKASSTNMLESLYNFKNNFIVTQPLLQIATTASTKCVYSTPVIATAMAQSSTVCNDAYYVSSCERDSQCSTETDMPRIYDFFKATEDDIITRRDYQNDCLEDFNTSTSSLERSTSSQQATIPEMVEDALEIISQDGDYMERIGMDVRMQCILCSWAGPRIILEYHIRKDHPNEIHRQDRSDWNVTFTLGSLVQDQLWQSRVVECNSILYVISVKYEDPDYFMASLTMLSSESMPKAGTVTIYNKITGKPYTWSGDIDLLPPSLPYYAERICLKLQISCLDLLPNSANLELMNRELVIKSPSKVVVGQPDLNDIHVILFVNIFN